MDQTVKVWILYKKWWTIQIKILKLKLVQIKCPHITTNTTQHRSEREPTNHNKHKTKVPPWVWVCFRSKREREAWGDFEI